MIYKKVKEAKTHEFIKTNKLQDNLLITLKSSNQIIGKTLVHIIQFMVDNIIDKIKWLKILISY